MSCPTRIWSYSQLHCTMHLKMIWIDKIKTWFAFEMTHLTNTNVSLKFESFKGLLQDCSPVSSSFAPSHWSLLHWPIFQSRIQSCFSGSVIDDFMVSAGVNQSSGRWGVTPCALWLPCGGWVLGLGRLFPSLLAQHYHQEILPAVRSVHMTVNGLWTRVEVPTSYMSP